MSSTSTLPEALRPLAEQVSSGALDAEGLSWLAPEGWSGDGRTWTVARLPTVDHGLAEVTSTPLLHADARGRLVLRLVPGATAWDLPVPVDAGTLATLPAAWSRKREGATVTSTAYLGLIGGMSEIEKHLALSKWMCNAPELLSSQGGPRVARFRSAFSGAVVEIRMSDAIQRQGSRPTVAIVEAVPDGLSRNALVLQNMLKKRNTPQQIPLDVVAALDPAPMLGRPDLTPLLNRQSDQPARFQEALPNVWAHVMMGDPKAPAAHLVDFLGHAKASVRLAAFSLAYGWKDRALMARFRDAEQEPVTKKSMSRKEIWRR